MVQVKRCFLSPPSSKHLTMNSIRNPTLSSTLFKLPSQTTLISLSHHQRRGIRVKVYGSLEQALSYMQRIMQSSGVERLIKNEQTHHLKNSEKRVLARKELQRKIQSQDLSRKLRTVLIKKVRGL